MFNNEVHQFDIKLTTYDSESRTIVERMEEEYEIDIRTVETTRPESEMTDEDATRNLHDLKDRLKKFGAVNLLALEEYKTASEREKFLGEQLSDLKIAKDDLQSTITKINNTAREMFAETFEKVRTNFKNLFMELFTGGEADIMLVNPSDPLDSDIDIIARPKGKKLLSITMMSGGERALTAISLLFSLYLVKPSPFCILDEIDAPLDDANCKRFLKIIDKFSNQTQFIMITHNKISMEASHNLYGVTMEQFGISKLVAVKFNEAEEDEINENNMLIDTVESDAVKAEEIELDDSDENGNGNGNGNNSEIEETSTPVTDYSEEKPVEIKTEIDNSELPPAIAERISADLSKETAVTDDSVDEDKN